MGQRTDWKKSQRSHIWIFNVERGLSIFIRTPLNQGIWYDLGYSSEFKPSEFLKENILPHLSLHEKNALAQTIISHPHIDHISEIECLLENPQFKASLHTCPHDKCESEKINWNRIKNPEGSEKKEDIYKKLYEGRQLPLQTISYDSPLTPVNLEYGLYYVRPPVVEEIFPNDDLKYGNGLSLVLYYRHGKHTLLIPGDITPECLKHILEEDKGAEKRYTIFDKEEYSNHSDWPQKNSNQPSLKKLLNSRGLSVLIAPHHGLKSGFSNELYETIKDNKPDIVIISEKRYISDAEGEIESIYQSEKGAEGLKIYIEGEITDEKRYSITTKNGHHILILLDGTTGTPEIYLEKDPIILLDKLK